MRALVATLIALTAAPLYADEPASLNQARQLYARGAELVKKAQWSEALAAFEQSAALRPHPVTTYNRGACERALGRYTRAQKTLERALDENAHSTDAGALPESLAADARSYLAEIDHLLARIDVTIAPAEAAIAVDGRPLEVAQANPPVLLAGMLPAGPGVPPPAPRFELVVDPGAHVLTLSRKGFADVVVNRTFQPGSRSVLGLQLDRLPATLHVAASRPGAAVTVDGVDVGLAPIDLSRPAGSYKVAVKKQGYLTYQAQVSIAPGEQLDLRAALEEKRTPIYRRWWFWTAGGVILVGVGLGAYFGARAAETPKLDMGGLGWAVQAR
jgi:tetratricopeptide (TPR) repeat protein